MQRIFLILILAVFSALTVFALWQHGVWGIVEPHFQSFGAAQVFVDLLIALSLGMIWMWQDAKATGRKAWPWILLTLTAGSFGPLLYLLTRKPAQKS
jgi:Terpene cyclase DEP1